MEGMEGTEAKDESRLRLPSDARAEDLSVASVSAAEVEAEVAEGPLTSPREDSCRPGLEEGAGARAAAEEDRAHGCCCCCCGWSSTVETSVMVLEGEEVCDS